jgi:hypothetical protein
MYLGFSFNRILSVRTVRIASSELRIGKASNFALGVEMCWTLPGSVCVLIRVVRMMGVSDLDH